MKISLKQLLGILLIGAISVNSYSQNDTTKIKKIDSEINVTKSTDQLKAKSLNTNVNPNASIDLKIEKQINTEAIEKNLNANKSKINLTQFDLLIFCNQLLRQMQKTLAQKYILHSSLDVSAHLNISIENLHLQDDIPAL